MKLMLLCFLWFPFMALADEAAKSNYGQSQEQYIDVGQWQVSLAVGAGVKTNPLFDGNHIPLIIVPDIAFYGESFYFDNGDLGYAWRDEPHFVVSTMLRLNTERAYFSFWHPANILLNPSISATASDDASGGVTDSNLPSQDGFVLSIDEVASRRFAIDAGVQALWYFDDGGQLSFEWFNDVTGVYKGHHGMVSYAHGFAVGQVKLLAHVGVKYKSAALVDYYYGIDDKDKVSELFHYQGKKSVSPVLKLDVRYPLNQDWQLISFIRYETLGDGMSDSPLVKSDYVATGFVGVSYAF